MARPDLPPGPYVVAGLGRAGHAAVRRLSAGGNAVAGWDRAEPPVAPELSAAGVRIALGGDGLDLLEPEPGCVVKSPGIAPDVALLQAARRQGIPVIDELELGWRLDDRPLVAVTGTNGKSTVAALALAALRAGGARPALAGNTAFGPPLSALGRDARDVVVCEVSSFQLEGCPALLPEIAVLTNLTEEHLDRHGTMRRYGDAKRRLFIRGPAAAATAVVNVDGEFGRSLAADVEGRGCTALRYGEGAGADYRLLHCRWTLESGWLEAETPRGRVELATRLPGRHNALNVLAALAVADAVGVAPAQAVHAIAAAPPVPGRFEAIAGGQPFDVIVDYAHNPDGIRRSLEAARAIAAGRPGAHLRVVCSAPRIRGEPQRRAMGAAAAALADDLILTTERWPLTDAAPGLAEGLEEGAGDSCEVVLDRGEAIGHAGNGYEVVLDRGEAIERAVAGAHAGDVVMILGRGAGSGELVSRDGRLRPFDDRVAARRAVARCAQVA